ncbi:MAG: MgtC/SapB family protein [Fibrobacteres bacterium]|nr:MgtC/SapB family protein [Fibrobacterota bacterium]
MASTMDAFLLTDQAKLPLALGLSALIGLERERSRAGGNPHAAGVRTHMLVALFGFLMAQLHQAQVPFAIVAGLVVVGAIQVASFWRRVQSNLFGWSSELSVLLSYSVGVLCLLAPLWVPTAAAVLGTLILTEKSDIEKYVERLDQAEFLGVLKFLLVTTIVLPMLPDQGYTQWDLNPARIWKIVVLVSSVGFVGYFLTRKLGGKVGLWISGLVGGVVSSTAVAVSTGRLASREPAKAGVALQAALLASSIMYLRILVLIWLVSPAFAWALVWKLPLLSAIGVLLALTVPKLSSSQEGVESLKNPFEILPALGFAAFFTLFWVATAVVRNWLGASGLVLLGLIVGAVDIDPFILSVAKGGQVESALLAAILMSMLSNTVAKGVYFGSLAAPVRKQAFMRYFGWALLHIPLALM